AFFYTAAEQRVKTIQSAFHLFASGHGPRFRSNNIWIHDDPASDNAVIVRAAPVTHAAIFKYANDASLSAVIGIKMLKRNYTVGDTAHLQIPAHGGFVIQQ